MPAPVFVPYPDRYEPPVPAEQAAASFHDVVRRRRSVRMFSDRPVSLATIEWLVRAAHSAPSGANKQPWRFVCVRDPATKSRIRAGAEAEEREFYARRANAQWLADLEPLGTDEHKEFLTVAPWLVVVFQMAQLDDGGQVYYLKESVGLACGLFLAAAQFAGLATLTHTPSPMAFLGEILGRPKRERPFLLIPVGHPSDDCLVPQKALERRPLDEVMVVV
ncbi:MAG TPA: nitroreductase family protein [Planctomycetota bacterium]|nr:nitroreductase family protein [Planctomycetota bacterium]